MKQTHDHRGEGIAAQDPAPGASKVPHRESERPAGRTAGGYPPPPWRLRGQAVLRLQRMDARDASIPPALKTVRVPGGKTFGGLYLASYGEGSTLRYHELILFSALVRSGGRLGAWVSDIYVDDERSAAAGREIWGLPKQLARFRSTSDGSGRTVFVGEDSSDRDSLLCEVRIETSGRGVKLPVFAPAWSAKGSSMLWFRASGFAKFRPVRGEIRVPPSSPLAGRGLTGGRMLLLDEMDMRVGYGRLMQSM